MALVRDGRVIAKGHVGDVPFVEEPIRLHPREMLVLTKEQGAVTSRISNIPHISCTLPEAFSRARAGHPIFFDDGKIGGVIRKVHPDHIG